ncbi:unnamed protein product [Mucor hiemalis]
MFVKGFKMIYCCNLNQSIVQAQKWFLHPLLVNEQRIKNVGFTTSQTEPEGSAILQAFEKEIIQKFRFVDFSRYKTYSSEILLLNQCREFKKALAMLYHLNTLSEDTQNKKSNSRV